MAHCPECEAVIDIDVDEVEEGELLNCPECGVDLEVVSTNPVELDLAEDEDLEEDEEELEEDEEMVYEEDEEEEEEEEDDFEQ